MAAAAIDAMAFDAAAFDSVAEWFVVQHTGYFEGLGSHLGSI